MREKREKLQQFARGTSFRVGLIVLVVVLVVLDVMQTSTVSTKGYEISQLQQDIRELQQETGKLDYEIAKNRSMESIQARLGNLDLVEADTAEFLALADKQVAQR